MKNKELFHKNISHLVKGYLNDTLRHDDCKACAVGNIVAGNLNFKIRKCEELGLGWVNSSGASEDPYWHNSVCTLRGQTILGRPTQHIDKYALENNEFVLQQINSTGYSIEEVARIEYAFETAPKGKNEHEWIYNGLMACIDVICEIHECAEEVIKETKELFQKV